MYVGIGGNDGNIPEQQNLPLVPKRRASLADATYDGGISRTGVLPAEKANCSSDKGLGDAQEPCEEPDNVLRGMLGRMIL